MLSKLRTRLLAIVVLSVVAWFAIMMTSSNHYLRKFSGRKAAEAVTPEPEAFYEKTYNFHAVPHMFKKNLKPIYHLGKGPSHKVSIIAGIPSVKRKEVGLKYLYQTLRTLLHNMYPVNEDDVAVVVFLAESDLNYIETEAKYIYGNFTRQVDIGLLQLIAPDPSMYPDFYNLPQTLGDTKERIKWRSKEVFDAAYLMHYCTNKADYYLMLEDDVLAAKGYVEATKQFAEKQADKQYLYLLLSIWDSKAVLFRMKDVPKWVTYFFTFFADKPIDWLMWDFVRLVSCSPEISSHECTFLKHSKLIRRESGLFQHIGKVSSLNIKSTNQIDPSFLMEIAAAKNLHRNPPAKVSTSFTALTDSSHIALLYNDGGGMRRHFHGRAKRKDDYIIIEFVKLQTISKLLVKTGNDSSELFSNSTLLEYHGENSIEYKQCAVFDHNGEAECRFNNQPIKNIRIRTLEEQKHNVCIKFIYVA